MDRKHVQDTVRLFILLQALRKCIGRLHEVRSTRPPLGEICCIVLALAGVASCAEQVAHTRTPATQAPANEPNLPPEPPANSNQQEKCGAMIAGSSYCFPSEAEACAYLNCPGNRCSLGYSLPPVVSCASADDEAAYRP